VQNRTIKEAIANEPKGKVNDRFNVPPIITSLSVAAQAHPKPNPNPNHNPLPQRVWAASSIVPFWWELKTYPF